MDIGSFIVGLAIAIVAFAFVAKPLFTHEGVRVTQEDRRLSQLQANRERLLRSLQELETDFAVGKITQDDYQEQRAQYVAEGAATLREIDEITGSFEELSQARDLDAEIEAAVEQLRTKDAGDRAQFCPSCGNAVLSDDQFCTSCGESLSVENSEI
jgi:3-hydroxyacyl-CoA dehydrogenase